MQPAFHFSARKRCGTIVFIASFLGLLGLVVTGCRPPIVREVAHPQPFQGVILKLACADPAYAHEIVARGKSWGIRTGGSVVLEKDWTQADLAIIPPVRIGELTEAGVLAGRAENLAERDNALRWAEVMPAFEDRLCNWGRRPMALPIAGDGYVLVYRSDRFADPKIASEYRTKYQKELVAPQTWEDLRNIATVFAQEGKPSLAPLPASPEALAIAFHQVAACYDRFAVVNARKLDDTNTNPEPVASKTAFRFYVDPETATPRLTAASFVAAFDWFHDTAKYRAATGDPLDTLVNGTTIATIVSLADLTRLPRVASGAVDPRFSIAPVPGAAVWYGPNGVMHEAFAGRNYVPYLGAGGQLGVVFKRTQVADAAWDFLADLAGVRGSDETLAEVSLGAGPFRYSHLGVNEKSTKWQRYGFDTARTEQLARAVNEFVNVQVREPVYPLRTPDHAARTTLLAGVIRKAGTGALTGKQAAAEAQKEWLAEDEKTPKETRQAWSRRAAGMN